MGATGVVYTGPPSDSFEAFRQSAQMEIRREASMEAYEAGARDALKLKAMPAYPGSLFGGKPKKAKKE